MMFRTLFYAFAGLSLCGCVTNNLTTQNAQLAPGGAGVAVRPAPPRAPVMTPTARLVNAKMITVNKTTTAGATLILSSFHSLGSDCLPLGDVAVKIITPPDHGTVFVDKGMAFSNYAPGDPPYLCNARKSPATVITYRSSTGFTGLDTASLEVFFPDGRAPTMLFHIDVR